MSDPGAQRKCVAHELEKFVVETRAVHAIRVPHRVHEGLETGLAAIRERPESIHSYLPVIQCLVRLDRLTEARGFAADLLRMDPGFTIAKFNEVAVSQGDEWRQQAVHDYRLAGLPE
jgi:hypothetical protein